MARRVVITPSIFNVSKPGYNADTAPYRQLLLSLSARFGQVISSGSVEASEVGGFYEATAYIPDYGAFVDAIALPVAGGVWVNYAGLGWTRVYYSERELRRFNAGGAFSGAEYDTQRVFTNNTVTFRSPISYTRYIVSAFTYYVYRKPLTA